MTPLVSFDTAASVASWVRLDDDVMGGISRSHLRYDPMGYAVFEGVVSLEHNGGFASVRSGPLAFPLTRAIHLNVRGDGKRYKLALLTEDLPHGAHYQAGFDTQAGTWISVCLLFSAFIPTYRGRVLPGASLLDSSAIRQIGFVIAEKQAGVFALEVRSIYVE